MIAKLIKIKYVLNDSRRIDGRHYLNNDALLSSVMVENEDKCLPLSECALAFNPPVFKRQFCQDTEKAVQYFQSSDVPSAKERSNVFINKAQAKRINASVKENQILITGFGTIGNVRLASRLQEGVAYANNVCRVEVKENHKYGFIYAFLASRYGRAQMNKNASGSVVRYIESPGIRKILIPAFTDEKQQQIHLLIKQSAEMRVEANRLLEEAEKRFLDRLRIGLSANKKFQVASKNIIQLATSFQKRIDAPAFLNKGIQIIKQLKENDFEFISLKECKVSVSRPGIFKRIYVKVDGFPYIKGSELELTNPFNNCVYLSKKKTPFLNELTFCQNQILITCAGSVGNVRIITKEFEDLKAIGSQDIIRIECQDNDLFSNEYIFAYLRLPFVFDFIQSLKYGSVIERIEPFHVDQIPVLIPTKDFSERITKIIQKYKENIYNAFIKENQAIQLIEKEIEQWQQ